MILVRFQVQVDLAVVDQTTNGTLRRMKFLRLDVRVETHSR